MAMYKEKWEMSVWKFDIFGPPGLWFDSHWAQTARHEFGPFISGSYYNFNWIFRFACTGWVEISFSDFLQVLLTGFRSLPPLFEDTPDAVHELTIASNILNSILLPHLLLFSPIFSVIIIRNGYGSDSMISGQLCFPINVIAFRVCNGSGNECMCAVINMNVFVHVTNSWKFRYRLKC